MADQRDGGIAWCTDTWNPVRGCSVVSPGCANCYAARVAARFSGHGQPYEGLAERSRVGPRWTGRVRLVEERLGDPLKWTRPRRVFVNSMSDLFHERLTDNEIAAIFGVMAMATRHTFQILTKRPTRMREWFRRADPGSVRAAMHGHPYFACREEARRRGVDVGEPRWVLNGAAGPWPLQNVWLGVSVEDQARADERVPLLIETPAAVRFLSVEPLLGPVDLNSSLGGTRWMGGQRGCGATHRGNGAPGCPREEHHHHDERCGPGIDWVIVGGESGPGHRPMNLDWARSIRDQCAAFGVPFFFKQSSGPKSGMGRELDGVIHEAFPKGGAAA